MGRTAHCKKEAFTTNLCCNTNEVMKKWQVVLGVIMMFGLILVSCEKEEGATPSQPKPNTPTKPITPSDSTKDNDTTSSFSAKFEGELKEANFSVRAVIYDNTKSVHIAAIGNTGGVVTQFTLSIGDFVGVGVYKLGTLDSRDLGMNATYLEKDMGYECSRKDEETKGELKVTEYVEGKVLKGTFQFKAKRVSGAGPEYANFTEGKFIIYLN
jgi:hypothetical protein